MAFSSGRSILRAEIEDQFFVLKRMVEEIYNNYRKFRHLIVHNLCDSKMINEVKKLFQGARELGLIFSEETMVIKSPQYLLESIERMKNVLVELALKYEKKTSSSTIIAVNYDSQ